MSAVEKKKAKKAWQIPPALYYVYLKIMLSLLTLGRITELISKIS